MWLGKKKTVRGGAQAGLVKKKGTGKKVFRRASLGK